MLWPVTFSTITFLYKIFSPNPFQTFYKCIISIHNSNKIWAVVKILSILVYAHVWMNHNLTLCPVFLTIQMFAEQTISVKKSGSGIKIRVWKFWGQREQVFVQTKLIVAMVGLINEVSTCIWTCIGMSSFTEKRWCARPWEKKSHNFHLKAEVSR